MCASTLQHTSHNSIAWAILDVWWWSPQNLVDSLAQHFQEAVPAERHGELNTFVVYNQRSRVTSSAKRKRQPGSLSIHQTPDGSFLDLMRNARDVLLRCSFDVPQVGPPCPNLSRLAAAAAMADVHLMHV